MTANRADPRIGAQVLADRLLIPRALTPGKRFLEEAQDELFAVSRCVSAVVARSRIRALRTRARRAGESVLVNDLDLLLTEGRSAPNGPAASGYECVFCGDCAVRFLRNWPYHPVCGVHSAATARARDLCAIHRMLLDPSDAFFAALILYPSTILLEVEDRAIGPSTVETIRHHWPRFLSEYQMTSRAPAQKVLAFWQFCCDPYPETWETPSPIASNLWNVVFTEARDRDAMASAQNGQQGGRPRDERQEKAIARLAARGLTQKAIAAKLGTAQCQVSRVLRRLRAP